MGTGQGDVTADLDALMKYIASYAAPVWSTNASGSSFKKIQTAQNAALRAATGAHKIASIDHLYQESLTLKARDHSDMLSAQYLANCREEDHVCHGITTQKPRPRPMKETLHSRHHSTVLPKLGASREESIRNLHTHAVDTGIQLLGNNRVLEERPPPIADEEQRLNQRQRCTLSQLRSGSNEPSLHDVEQSGNYRCQEIEIISYPDSPLFISTGFLPRVSSKRLN